MSPEETSEIITKMMGKALGMVDLEGNTDAFFEETGLDEPMFMAMMGLAAARTSPEHFEHGLAAMVHLGYLLAHELAETEL